MPFSGSISDDIPIINTQNMMGSQNWDTKMDGLNGKILLKQMI